MINRQLTVKIKFDDYGNAITNKSSEQQYSVITTWNCFNRK